MGYILEIDTVLKIPNSAGIDFSNIKKGDTFSFEKEGERFTPLHKPIETCDENYKYIGKVVIRKLIIEKNKTTYEIEILKVFSEEESKIFSENFIKKSEIS